MRHSVHSTHLTGSLAAVLLAAILVTGCGASSPRPTTATGSGATASASRAPSTVAPTASDSTPPGPLAFAACMRAHGVPNFPDPQPGGGFDIPVSPGLSPAAPSFQAAQSKCQRLMGGGAAGGPLSPGGPLSRGTHTHPSPQTLAKLLRIARCMRQHGVSDFPDPRTSIPSDPFGSGISEVSNFDGVILLFPATMNLQAPAYKQALTACGAPPLGLHH